MRKSVDAWKDNLTLAMHQDRIEKEREIKSEMRMEVDEGLGKGFGSLKESTVAKTAARFRLERFLESSICRVERQTWRAFTEQLQSEFTAVEKALF